MSLPLELILLVAKTLLNERPTLSSLARTSSRLYAATQPILYGQVELSSQTTIASFCETILDGPRQCSSFVKILAIGKHTHPSEWLHLPKSLAILLRATFSRLLNLRDLSIITTTSTFYIFVDLEFTFKLTRLRVPCVDCAPLYMMLSHQPSITELHLASSNPRDSSCVGTAMSTLPEILPRLNSITASPDVLIALVPGRPVSEVLIESDAVALVRVPESALDSVFCGSTVPLRSTGYYHPAPHSDDWDSQDPWSITITTLEDRNIRQMLTKIRIFETSNNMVPIGPELKRLIHWRMSCLGEVAGFDSLQRFEMGLAYVSPLPQNLVRSWLGEFRELSTWQVYVPSLRSVSIYDVEIL